MSLLGRALRLRLLFLAGAAPFALHGLHLLPERTAAFEPLRPTFGGPLLALPPGRAAVHAGPLALVHVGAHGAGEGETQAGLLLVGAAEVHGKDVLEETLKDQFTLVALTETRRLSCKNKDRI